MDIAKKILEYEEWIGKAIKVIEHQQSLVTRSPKDPTIAHDTDELTANGYSLKGQDIEISCATGNIFFEPSIFTFARWLEQEK